MSGIFGKDDMSLKEAEESLKIQEELRRQNRHHDSELDKKRAVLAVSVTAVTLVIVAAWLLTLPMQLKQFKVLDSDSVARWYAVQDEIDAEGVTLQEQFDEIKSQMDQMAEDLELASGSDEDDEEDKLDLAERLRETILEKESIIETEQDATTQEEQQ
jgi:hypothetical protein